MILVFFCQRLTLRVYITRQKGFLSNYIKQACRSIPERLGYKDERIGRYLAALARNFLQSQVFSSNPDARTNGFGVSTKTTQYLKGGRHSTT